MTDQLAMLSGIVCALVTTLPAVILFERGLKELPSSLPLGLVCIGGHLIVCQLAILWVYLLWEDKLFSFCLPLVATVLLLWVIASIRGTFCYKRSDRRDEA